MSGEESYLKPSVGKCQVIDLSLSKQKYILPPLSMFNIIDNFRWNREGYFSGKMSLFSLYLILPKFFLCGIRGDIFSTSFYSLYFSHHTLYPLQVRNYQ